MVIRLNKGAEKSGSVRFPGRRKKALVSILPECHFGRCHNQAVLWRDVLQKLYVRSHLAFGLLLFL